MNTPNVTRKAVDVNSPARLTRQSTKAHKAVMQERVKVFGYFAHVISSDAKATYTVFFFSDEGPASCDCEDYKHLSPVNECYRCYHIIAAEIQRRIDSDAIQASLDAAWEAEAMQAAAQFEQDLLDAEYTFDLLPTLDRDDLTVVYNSLSVALAEGWGDSYYRTTLAKIEVLRAAA